MSRWRSRGNSGESGAGGRDCIPPASEGDRNGISIRKDEFPEGDTHLFQGKSLQQIAAQHVGQRLDEPVAAAE